MVASIRSTLLALFSVAALSVLTTPAQAHSSAWPTITRSEHVAGLRHEILPRSAPLVKRGVNSQAARPHIITRDDTIRLQFSAYNTTFHLYLEPNTDFIHPEADLGDLSHDDIKAFKGVVVQDEEYSNSKWKRASTTSRIAKRTVEHMLYEEGVVGWARMMVEHDDNSEDGLIVRGAFMVHDDTYHVTSRKHYHVQKRSDDATPSSASSRSNLIIYRDSDLYKPSFLAKKKRGLPTDEVSCGADTMLNKTAAFVEAASSPDHYYPPDLTASIPMMGGWSDILKAPLTKRQVSVSVAGPNPVPTGCPPNRLVNYMGVAADCAYVRSYGGPSEARKQIFADFNTASGIYESTFNIALGIITINIMSENCPTTPVSGVEWNQDCSATYTIDQRLSDFSRWRGADDRSSDGAGLWHLMTKCNSGAVVGIAWTKALCQMKSQSQNAQGQVQYTAGTGVSSITPNEWMVVAHEIGHGFGAIHDCTTTTCPASSGQCCPLSATTCDAGAKYIMNPSEQTATKVFSPCSIKSICSAVQTTQCLQAPGSRSVQSGTPNICGNGLKEPGEDCDCGSADDCAADPCCDGTTCKFKNGAICDDLNDDCCQNCQLKAAGQVCRQAISVCDYAEVCSGTSPTCPPDKRVDNLTPCQGPNNATGLQCANGVCTSRDLQCQQQDREGITKACGASSSCDLLCNDPNGNAMTCMQIPGTYFVDGSPCGFGGTCASGQCKYSSINGVLNWARNHLQIVIPVACVLGLLLLCCIWSCCCTRIIRSRRQKKVIRGSNRSRSSSHARRSDVHPGGPGSLQGAQHNGQLPPMAAIPPPPVYNDPYANTRSREEDELHRAMEESRREYERQHPNTASHVQEAPLPDVPQSRNGASVVATPRVDSSTYPPAPYTPNTNVNSNNSWNARALGGMPSPAQPPETLHSDVTQPSPYASDSSPNPLLLTSGWNGSSANTTANNSYSSNPFADQNYTRQGHP
ncbi:Metallo-peptidase family M12-domain-containing protein [Mortierella sp. GBAus27b]|nr:hypothetical protein BGX31_009096 [Mortierella sp. GBA43]KAI8357470.1 Metallo-peptidase family M12-domain-containing protein [Mortierella sp. GBAus27b]